MCIKFTANKWTYFVIPYTPSLTLEDSEHFYIIEKGLLGWTGDELIVPPTCDKTLRIKVLQSPTYIVQFHDVVVNLSSAEYRM